ncbi:hypothetical protein PC116_g33174, partial [Phytophthora cactorum]
AGRLVSHLNDFFYVSHWHDPEDGFAHLEEQEEEETEEDRKGGETASLDSASSVVRRSTADSMSIPVLTSTPRPGPSRSSATYVNREDQMTGTDQISLSSSRASSFAFPSITESDIATLALQARQVNQDVEAEAVLHL